MASQKTILNALERRYDYYAARTVLAELVAATGLEEVRDFGAKELGKLADALGKSGSRVDGVVDTLKAMAAEAKGSAAKKDAAPAKPPSAPKKPAAKK